MKKASLHPILKKAKTLSAVTLKASLTCLVAAMLFSIKSLSQNHDDQKHYTCYRADKPIQIDGKLTESAWKRAPWTDLFVDIEGSKKPLPLQNTRAKLVWDDTYLYIAAVMEEQHIWAYQSKKDQIVYLENDFEVFIDPDGDSENYYELEINAINNSFDLFLPKTYRNGGRADLKWDIKDLKSAVSIEGTINNPSDTDKQWTLEIAIPLESLSTKDVPAVIPHDGAIWRLNFSRVNWQHTVTENKYSRLRNAQTNKIIPEYNWVWSPQGKINMHIPETWGYLHFSSGKPKKNRQKYTSK